MYKSLSFLLVSMLVAAADSSFGAQSFLGTLSNVRVVEVRTFQDDRFGGCVVVFNAGVNINTDGTVPLNCPRTDQVSLNCAGDTGGTKTEGNRMFNSAQLALVAGRRVQMSIRDSVIYGEQVCQAYTFNVMRD